MIVRASYRNCVSHAACRASPPGAEGSGAWQAFTGEALREPTTIDEIRDLMAQSGDRLLTHDPVWVAARGPNASGGDNAEPVYGLRRNGRMLGYAAFVRGTRTLRFAIGELTLYRHLVPSLTLVHDVTLAAAPEAERIGQICDLLALLALHAAPRRALFLEGVPTESALFAAATQRLAGSGWIVVRLGESYEHQFADLPPSYELYERQLGGRSRQSLRYSRRKLLEHVDGALRACCFAERRDVAAFVAAAQAISKKTYQWNLLDLGLRDAATLAARLELAADHGWMRCYILYCRDEPVAFMLGYVYCGVYYYMDVGYDPAWAKWSVGSILQMDVVKDLLSSDDPPSRFDFSTGFGSHKARFGNAARQEANILMLPAGLFYRLIARGYRVSVVVDKKVGAAADALGIKTRLKKWLRRVG
jgi:hypothetical protein